jgi:putative FmdB family regulatory protein
MPTYDYACLSCAHRFDAVQSMSDEPLALCPVCGGRLRRVFGTVGVTFKGSGFYRTDSRPKRESGTAKPKTTTATTTPPPSTTGSSTKTGSSA